MPNCRSYVQMYSKQHTYPPYVYVCICLPYSRLNTYLTYTRCRRVVVILILQRESLSQVHSQVLTARTSYPKKLKPYLLG